MPPPFRTGPVTGPTFTSTPPATRKRMGTPLKVALILAATLVVALAVWGIGVLTDTTIKHPPATSSAPATPVANGIPRPDPTCVTTNGDDHHDMWDADGWWAGRVDGEVREMRALAVLSLKLNGHEVDSAWICAPRPGG